MNKKSKLKILLLSIGIIFMDILGCLGIFLLAVITLPIWGFMALGDILGDMIIDYQASREYAEDMKEIKRREKK